MKKKYYISCPNFLREKKQKSERAPLYLNNVVIRPELTPKMKNILPDNQNVIIIGDIYEGNRLKMLQVKGIQLIDSSMSFPNDIMVRDAVCNYSFERGEWSISDADYEDTYFTPNNICKIIDSCFTVKKPEDVRKTYEEWNKYIEFRKYYLDEQSKRNFKLDSVEYVKAFAVNRKDYNKKYLLYKDYILDGIKDFAKGEMVVLSKKIEEAEPFPLVRLNIDRNKKQFEESRISKKGKLVNEEEIKIRLLANDNVLITSEDPEGDSRFKDKKGNTQKIQITELLNSGYELGDRFKIISFCVEPKESLEKLDRQYEADINRGNKEVDIKYEKIIKNELDNAVDEFAKEIDVKIKSLIDNRKKELDFKLDLDVSLNQDLKILNMINAEKANIKNKIISSNKKIKNMKGKNYPENLNRLIDSEYAKIDIRKFYVDRNNAELERFKRDIELKETKELEDYKIKKRLELKNKYESDIKDEKTALRNNFDINLTVNKEKVKKEETIIRFSLYFRLGNLNNITEKQIQTIKKCKYIAYDNRAENAKIKRQEMALNNFYSGYVKNPYLSTYLFDPQMLSTVQDENSDWVWFLETLNEKQKEAVRKAVSSNGIFLLQGPPGTGKTQVIAETVAQMVRKGKKVLISSETHKAIDNVFERLPKVAEIIPIRLIPSNNKKSDNDYDPKFLVDNFYKNVSFNMKKSIKRYENFKQNKEEFSENYKEIQILREKNLKLQESLKKLNKEISKLDEEFKKNNSKISYLREKENDINTEKDKFESIIRYIGNNNFNFDDIDSQLNAILCKDFQDLLVDKKKSKFNTKNLFDLVKKICTIRLDEVSDELVNIRPDLRESMLEIKREKLKSELDGYYDDLRELKDPADKEKVEKIKQELKIVVNDLNKKGNIDNSSLKLCEIFKYEYLAKNTDNIKDEISSLKENLSKIKSKYTEELRKKISKNQEELDGIDEKIDECKNHAKSLERKIFEIKDEDNFKDCQDNYSRLINKIDKFFKDFEISVPYRNIDEALEVIKNRWDELEENFAKKEQENKEKIPMYKKISDYLSANDVVENDRKNYTKDLFESANVFGITCTSNDRFNGRNVEALSEYNIEDFDIKSVGIDVVIIDEVSKSSFIDLLIPILYGKTVILVGDHRQLPPMYEFARLRDEDFEGLDENIINKNMNIKFTKLYEECFFKTLFERIPDCYKIMLVQQYRCHEHIMNVFNHFYQGELKLGLDGQNNSKKHNIELSSNGIRIIEPDKHIYFVNCRKNETHEQDSTSMYNSGEAKVVVELIKKLNNYFKENQDKEKLSIGIICTYADQARKIKELMKFEKVKTDAFKTDAEKMIVSTVDDFQGDERDIIILSTVRNPENPARSNPGFILAYQRINVALSRARRLLIMVGNRKYLESKGVIDLPDINGNGNDRHNFRVYEEIISTIERYGKVIDDEDLLEDEVGIING